MSSNTPFNRARFVFLALLMFCLLPCGPVLVIPVDIIHSQIERKRLRSKTDHVALLAASRALMKQHAGERISNPGEDPRVPRIIRDLGPSSMMIRPDYLRVELHGGFDHYGFTAYAEGADPGAKGGKLIDGLYYYSE